MKMLKKVYSFISTLPFWICVIVFALLFASAWATGVMPDISSAFMDVVTEVFAQFEGFSIISTTIQDVAATIGVTDSHWIMVIANFFSWFFTCRVFYWLYQILTVVLEQVSSWLEGKLCD